MKQTLFAGMVLVVLAGCQNEHRLTAIRGCVQLNGKPVPHAWVNFGPAEDLLVGDYCGTLDENGTFSIDVDPQWSPARPGTFTMKVTAPSAVPLLLLAKARGDKSAPLPPEAAEMMKKLEAIPPLPANKQTVELHAGANDLGTIELKNTHSSAR